MFKININIYTSIALVIELPLNRENKASPDRQDHRDLQGTMEDQDHMETMARLVKRELKARMALLAQKDQLEMQDQRYDAKLSLYSRLLQEELFSVQGQN